MEKAWPVKVQYTRRALRHLISIDQYVRERNPPAADKIAERIEYTIKFLRDFPYSGRSGRRGGMREIRVPNLPYVVAYRIQPDETVLILGVYHAAQRRPGGPLG